jgi:hypothetical protein
MTNTPEYIPLTSIHRAIWVTFQKEGIHCYPRALTDPELADVSFLGHPHRHIFHFKVSIQVSHNDRDIEFIQFKRWLESLFDGFGEGAMEIDYKSCEMLAEELLNTICRKYPNRAMSVEVSEDGENGAVLYVLEGRNPLAGVKL